MRRTSTPGSGTPMLPAGASPSPMAVVTTGDASVRPYPSTRQKENRSCIARRVDSSSRAAPEVARRTVAKERSEEHTSELQSLMRNSYAVFCLKKKTHTTHDMKQQIRGHTVTQ